jgi:branched-chain amino acid transport system permease protein
MRLLGTTRPWTALAVAATLLVAFALPYQINSFKISVLALALVYALLAIGVNLLAGQAGLVSLGHAGIMASAGYAVALMYTRTSTPAIVHVVVGMAFAIVVSIVFGLMSMRTSGIYFLMATVAQGLIVWGLGMGMTRVTNGATGIRGLERPAFMDEDWQLYYVLLAVVTVALVGYLVIVRSPVGLILRGISGSPSRMAMLGYNVGLYKIYAFALSGIFAGAAGVFFLYYNRFISPDASSFLTSGLVLLMVILGGTGTALGPVVGAVAIMAVQNIVGTWTDRWPTVLGLLYVLVVLLAPDGVVGRVTSLFRRIRDRGPTKPGPPALLLEQARP